MKFFAFILLAFFIFAAGFLSGFKFAQRGGDLKNIYQFQSSCNYGGKVYKNGEGFKSLDGCNSCSCERGQVACTEMACLSQNSN